MIYITIYNFVTDEMKNFPFETVFDAEEFASNYPLTEDEEISIGNEIFGMLWEDYLCSR
jgi:hypothetical protein